MHIKHQDDEHICSESPSEVPEESDPLSSSSGYRAPQACSEGVVSSLTN